MLTKCSNILETPRVFSSNSLQKASRGRMGEEREGKRERERERERERKGEREREHFQVCLSYSVLFHV
jgi:hypothetical protein